MTLINNKLIESILISPISQEEELSNNNQINNQISILRTIQNSSLIIKPC